MFLESRYGFFGFRVFSSLGCVRRACLLALFRQGVAKENGLLCVRNAIVLLAIVVRGVRFGLLGAGGRVLFRSILRYVNDKLCQRAF